MADIRPFRGILYNTEKVGIADVVAPPYDVISPQQQQELYERSPYNVVRVILGREQDPYTSAATCLVHWLKEGILQQDARAAMYFVSQEFGIADRTRVVRQGIIAACRLEEFGKGSVFPHERTLSGPKEDRFKLFQSTQTMFSQILSLYGDRDHILDSHVSKTISLRPSVEVTFENVRNSLWRVQEEETIAAVSAFMRDKRIFIADGHHRYETALRYRDACRARNLAHRGQEPYNFVPMYLTNLHDSGLVILPTHRILHDVAGFNPGQFILELKKHFLVETVRPPDELLRRLAAEVGNAFGLFVGGQEDGYLLRLRDPERLDELPELIRRLDVSVLHTAVLKGTLGLTEEQQEKKINLNYERDPWRAIRAVKEEGAQAAFIMNPTRIDQVRAVAESGMVMPQKSTYFYPKLLSGLVAYSFGNE